jgi:hypothetical protein
MHAEAYQAFGELLAEAHIDRDAPWKILDLGGQNVNGTVHDWFTHPKTTITTLDLQRADIIADVTSWTPDRFFDIVISTELFEHIRGWRSAIRTAAAAGDILLATCASTRRPPHGMTGEARVPAGEWYGNVDPEDLREVLGWWYQSFEVHYAYPPGDAYLWAAV